MQTKAFLYARVLLPSLFLGLGGCGTDADEDLLEGVYTAEYEPPRLISTSLGCSRLISRAFLGVSDRGDFDLSINVIDDCSAGGGDFSFFEVLRLGTYFRQGTALEFRPQSGSDVFGGTLEGEFIRLRLPPSFGQLATEELEFLVGPRMRL